MILYRFANEEFATQIDGFGASKYGGRWNSKGFPIVYTSLTISLALIELLVHNTSNNSIKNNKLIILELPDDVVLKEVLKEEMNSNWQTDIKFSQTLGNRFLSSKSALLLKVPSAIIPQENNILINPRHQQIEHVKIKEILSFDFDLRLFS